MKKKHPTPASPVPDAKCMYVLYRTAEIEMNYATPGVGAGFEMYLTWRQKVRPVRTVLPKVRSKEQRRRRKKRGGGGRGSWKEIRLG